MDVNCKFDESSPNRWISYSHTKFLQKTGVENIGMDFPIILSDWYVPHLVILGLLWKFERIWLMYPEGTVFQTFFASPYKR